MYTELQTSIYNTLAARPELDGLVIKDDYPVTKGNADAILNSKGLILIVGKARQKQVNKHEVKVFVPIRIDENPRVNESDDGAGIAPEDVQRMVTEELNGTRPQDYWQPLRPLTFDQLDPEMAMEGLGVMVETGTLVL
jgi:hypothetical protein